MAASRTRTVVGPTVTERSCHNCRKQTVTTGSRCTECASLRRVQQRAERAARRGELPVCLDCSAPLPSRRMKRCAPCCKTNQLARARARDRRRYATEPLRLRNAVLCAGVCGQLINGCLSSRPAGERMCHPCRRLRRGGESKGGSRGPISCANPVCQQTIERPHGNQKYCARQCAERATPSTMATRERWARKNAKRRPPGLAASSGWAKLRARVIAEEPNCWICGDEINPAHRWPHPMCGTGDHIVPIEAGGDILDRENVHAAHRSCNQVRHVEWRRRRREIVRDRKAETTPGSAA